MKKNIVLFGNIPSDQQERLKQHFNVTCCHSPMDLEPDLLSTIEGMIGSNMRTKIDDQFLSHMPRLKAASTISVGYDHFDLDAVNRRKIRLMNTPTVLVEGTADLIFTLLMATARRITEMSRYIQDGKWKAGVTSEYYGVDIYKKTLGLIGMGNIAKALVKRAHAGFDMDILYYNRSAHPDIEDRFDARRCELDELLKHSDFVVTILPLTPQTECLITKEKLALMKHSAILINGARGKIIDEPALIHALQTGVIRAAGLDVFEKEPLPMNSPLLALDNVVLSPHMGSATIETRYAMAQCAVDNLIAALKVEKPTCNWVNPEVG